MKLICSQKTDEEFYKVLNETDGIKTGTKEAYIYSLKRITKITDKSLCDSLRTPKETYKKLAATLQRSTLNTTVSSVLAVLKHTGEKHKNKKLFDVWYEVCLPLFQEVKRVRLSNEPTERQKETQVTWEEVGEMYEKLKKEEYGSKAHLRLSFYYLLKPRRQADYHRIRVLTRKEDVETDSMDSLIDLRVKEPFIEVREYKTSKWHKVWKKTLNPEHVALIKWNIEKTPRTYMFEMRDGSAYSAPNSYTRDTNRILNKIWNKPVTVNSLRHSYSTHRNNDRSLSLGDRLEDAKDMGQSLGTHLAYVLRTAKDGKKPSAKFIMKKKGKTFVCTEVKSV